MKPYLYVYCRASRYRYSSSFMLKFYSILCQKYKKDLDFSSWSEYQVSIAERVAEWRHPIIQLGRTSTNGSTPRMSQKRSFSDFVTYAQHETSWRIVWSCMKCQNLWDAPALISCISKEWVMFFVGDNFKSVRYFEAHLKLCIIDEGNCQRSEKGGTKLTRHSSQILKVASKIHVRRARSSPRIFLKQWLLWGRGTFICMWKMMVC